MLDDEKERIAAVLLGQTSRDQLVNDCYSIATLKSTIAAVARMTRKNLPRDVLSLATSASGLPSPHVLRNNDG